MMFFFAIPTLATLFELVVTTALATLVALSTKDAYDKMTQSDDNHQ